MKQSKESHELSVHLEGDKRGKMMTDEDDEIIEVNFGTYKRYVMDFYGGWCFIFMSQFAMILVLCSDLTLEYVIGAWGNDPEQAGSEYRFYAITSNGICVASFFVMCFRCYNFLIGGVRASKKVHGVMVRSVFEAPLNRYFDTTPVGRILNRFSKDMNCLDESISWAVDGVHRSFYMLLYAIVLSVVTVPYCALMMPFIAAWAYCIVKRAAAAIKQTVRLKSTTKSPVLSHFQESLPGAPTIRAFKRQAEYIDRNYELCNTNLAAV
jgi:ABC-type multidrug transport system fused ATPase/permease subunit